MTKNNNFKNVVPIGVFSKNVGTLIPALKQTILIDENVDRFFTRSTCQFWLKPLLCKTRRMLIGVSRSAKTQKTPHTKKAEIVPAIEPVQATENLERLSKTILN